MIMNSWNVLMGSSSENYKRKLEIGVGAVVIIIGAFFVTQALTIGASKEMVGPRTMPMALAISMIIGGVWLTLRAITGRAGSIKADYGFLESDLKRISLVVACGLAFLASFWAFGYFIAIIITYISMLYAFGVRNKVWMLGGALAFAVVLQWLFMGVMLLNDPSGAIIDIRPFTELISGV